MTSSLRHYYNSAMGIHLEGWGVLRVGCGMSFSVQCRERRQVVIPEILF